VQDLTEVREILATRIKQWEEEFIKKGREEGLAYASILQKESESACHELPTIDDSILSNCGF